ncbi:MAG: T9SS type A sorting domain-containing protein, partial [Gemmatimonadota bacterium]|nr:T9SS type A sorting domain-containing protein [Gemmatimonadota bacterium]
GRIPSDVNIYAQHVNSLGAPTWDYNGVAVCTAPMTQNPGALVSDGQGGAIVVWDDDRTSSVDVYAQNITASGAMRWQYDGMPVCAAARSQFAPFAAADGSGGVISAWIDDRSGIYDVYAQRVELRYGYWGRPEPTVVSAKDNPGDQGGKVILLWLSSQRDRFDNPAISYYSVWRSTDFVAAAEQAAAPAGLVVHDPLDVPADFAGTALWERETANGPEYWEWIANQDAFYQSSYSLTAPTRQDSVAGNPATHYFKVIAHEYQYPQTRAWESGTVSARSVDNLAPAAPLFLAAQRVGANVNLRWNRAVAPDLRDYSVYRATSSGVTPVPVNLLANAPDTLLVDAGAPLTSLYYIVTAFDIHNNQSPASNEASVSSPTGVGDTPAITALTVNQNHPNPFTGSTTLAIGLPGESDVAIDVFDVAGRRVRTQTLARQPAGWRSLDFDGRDDQGRLLPSGVYFCRVQTAGETVTRKMVIAR